MIGVAAGYHKAYTHACVIDLCEIPGKSNVQTFEKYQLPKEKWPPNAVILNKHMETAIEGRKKIIKLTYEFTLLNGEKQINSETFFEEVEPDAPVEKKSDPEPPKADFLRHEQSPGDFGTAGLQFSRKSSDADRAKRP